MTVGPKVNTETKRYETNFIMEPFPQGLCLNPETQITFREQKVAGFREFTEL